MSKVTRTRNTAAKSAKRRKDLRRSLPKPTIDVWALLTSREFFNLGVVAVTIFLLVGVAVIWAREQVKVRDGQIMSDTRLKRIDYSTPDDEATAKRRESARTAAPRLYTINEQYLTELEGAIRGLPRAVANKNSLQEVSTDLIDQFRLDDAGLKELRMAVDADGQITTAWNGFVDKLMKELRQHPIFESAEFQRFTTSPAAAIRTAAGEIVPLPRDRGIELKPEMRREAPRQLADLVDRAGFTRNVKPLVLSRIMWQPKPVAVYDEARSREHADQIAAAVPEVRIEHKQGEVISKRGDMLSAKQYDELLTEAQRFAATARPWQIWQPRIGMMGVLALSLLFLAVFIHLYYPRIARNFLRGFAIALLMAVTLIASVMVTIQAPKVAMGAALAPTLFVAIVVLLAYDKRLGLIISGLQSAFVVLALELSVGWFLLLVAACAAAIVQLREVRHRNSLMRAATLTAGIVAVGALALGLLELPIEVEGFARQVGLNVIWGVTGCYGVAFFVLGLLPAIERWFDITTGMTLAELRDPRQPLLRQLQQKAPGTYNHSLQVANIAEAAADAIGADSLLIYVGALYHDIGKMSKPEYFVENQTGGPSKHDKLSPAMSLLVIIGHVKDGIELAREYGLPRSLIHFIEAHHGTTLVEYFYHAARTQAQDGRRKDTVDEVEFRYPGPKPQTKEAAILMLSDAVESASRAMGEPNPSRIEALVRELSRKRLADGQFDQCDLTFRELSLVEDAIISRVSAIHHGRISYPSGKAGRGDDEPAERTLRAPAPAPPAARTASA